MTKFLHNISIALLAMSIAVTAPAKEFFVFFGTYTDTTSKGIYVSRMDSDTGKLSPPELAAETASPSFLAVSPNERFLYAANEADHFKDAGGDLGGAVSAFVIDKAAGKLSLLNQISSGGSSPCHLSVDRSGSALLVANYGSGSVQTFRLATNGSIGAIGDHVARSGHGPNPGRQSSAHAHFISADPTGRFALSCDLGTDEVIVFPLTAAAARLNAEQLTIFSVAPGSGPRHLAFSPDGKFARVLNELACTITTFAWQPDAGVLRFVETISALPPGVTLQPSITAAEILTSRNHLYATLRGHDSISVFTADAQTGRIAFLQNVPSGGKIPRGLGIDPTGRWLLAGNQGTGNVVEFSIDPQSGKISPTGQELKIGSPVDVKFVSKP